MKIIADENIPLLKQYFDNCYTKPGREIVREDLLDADVLLVRAVTKVNKQLLHDTPVRFVGSVTTGVDHLDIQWLEQAGIQWSAATGCNAIAVVEYVICVIAALKEMNFLQSPRLRAGVIGVGNIGRRVAENLKRLGFDVVLCDPVLINSVKLDELAELDFITLHVPLTKTGEYPTYHFINKKFLQRQKKNCVLLNTSRGEVIAFEDLKKYGKHLIWCLDVWEHEPKIDQEVLERAIIATPHIAGYTTESKLRGIEMIYRAMVEKNIISLGEKESLINPPQSPFFKGGGALDMDVLEVYDPRVTTREMKAALALDENAFDRLRKNFAERHEFVYVRM